MGRGLDEVPDGADPFLDYQTSDIKNGNKVDPQMVDQTIKMTMRWT